jgi:hypothetical protein
LAFLKLGRAQKRRTVCNRLFSHKILVCAFIVWNYVMNFSPRFYHPSLFLTLFCVLTLTACQLPADLNSQSQDLAAPWDWSEEFVRGAVNQVRAGRNLNPESWPDGARVAVLLSFDVDNETCHGSEDWGD